MGEYAKAEPLYQEALRIRQKVLGPEHPDTATSLNNLAVLYRHMGEYAKAEPLYQEALRIRRRFLGQNIPTRRPASITWPCCTRRWASTPKPNRSTRKRSGSTRRSLGQNIPTRRHSLNNLAELYQAMGEYAKAEPLLQEALRIRQKVLGPEHPDTATASTTWPAVSGDGRVRQSRTALPGSAPDPAEGPWARTSRHGDSLNNLAELYQAMGEYAKAEPLLQEALRIRQKVLGPEHPDTAT